ncbi:MAG: methyltransferase domain-containing protein [Candidatus Dormiibacterota bacterium]
MKLNAAERLLVNNPARAMVQRHYEVPLLRRLGGRVDGGHVLELGCGRGVGVELILRQFGARRVTAIDLDPAMVEAARRRLTWCLPSELELGVGDATDLTAGDGTYDAVFDFGIIHHVPVWQDAVKEVARVLKPGGRFFFEEITQHALERWSFRKFLDHPTENRFSAEGFVQALEDAWIRVGDNYVVRGWDDLFIGVGRRA